MYRIVFLIISSLFFFSCKQEKTHRLPYYNTPDFSAVFIAGGKEEVKNKITHQVENFSFTDQNGRTITQNNIDGKIHVANFIFTSCGSICPVMTDHMQQVSNTFQDDNNVMLLSYSVMPWIDSVSRLKKYMERKKITNKNWHFLTGPKANIYRLARTSYFAEEAIGFTKDSTAFLHTEHFVLIDGTKRIRGIYNGTLDLEIDQLINDIKELKKESYPPSIF